MMIEGRLTEAMWSGAAVLKSVVTEHMAEIVLILALVLLFFTGIKKVQKRRRKSGCRKEAEKRKKKERQELGALGEYETSRVLEKLKGKKRFVFNAYIPKNSRSEYTEADIIVIHEKGILVIENKNYSGFIYGDAEKFQWIQIIGKHRFFFYNPIYQNEGHIRSLRSYLRNYLGKEYDDLPYESVIVFNDRAKIGQIRHVRKQAMVCSSRNAAQKLNQKLRRMPVVLNEKEIEDIYRKLKKETRGFFWVKASHKRNVSRKHR